MRGPNSEQITQMMKQAVARFAGAKPILHSDQGWQYQMIGYQNILWENGILLLKSKVPLNSIHFCE
ncbi:transposase [Haemophilus aegyptius ATCC 11116]|nr:transposase [Haemophilus aegyptius ATCC 11116]